MHVNEGLIKYTSNVTTPAGFPCCSPLAPSLPGPCISLFTSLSVAPSPSPCRLHTPRPALCLDPVTGALQFSLGWSTQAYPIFSTFTGLQVHCSGHPQEDLFSVCCHGCLGDCLLHSRSRWCSLTGPTPSQSGHFLFTLKTYAVSRRPPHFACCFPPQFSL